MQLKRLMLVIAMLAGVLGVIGCVAGIYLVWLIGSRLDQANEKVFVTVDSSLTTTQDRLRGVQQRVKDSKTRTGEIAQSLRDWSASKAKEKLVSWADIEMRAEKLAGHLQTADQWLQTSTETLRGVQRVLELAALAGTGTDVISLDKVLEQVMAMRDKVLEMEQSINAVGTFAINKENESDESRLSRIFKFLASTELAAGAIDARLDDSLARLSQIQTDALQSKTRTSNYILLATITGYLVLFWITAGQVALGLYGWRNRGAAST